MEGGESSFSLVLLLFKTTLPTHVRASLLIAEAEFPSLADSAQEAKNRLADLICNYLFTLKTNGVTNRLTRQDPME